MDAYRWRAHLRDGTTVDEGGVLCWADVRPHTAAVELVPTYDLFRRKQTLRVDVPEGARAVFFRRRSIVVQLSTAGTPPAGTLTCIGWEGEGGCAYLFADGDGRAMMQGKR